MKQQGLPEPKFIQELDFRTIIYRYTPQVTPQATPQLIEQPTEQLTEQLTEQVYRLILTIEGEMTRDELMDKLNLRHRPTFVLNYSNPALHGGWIEMTEAEVNHPNQKYRLTEKGLKVKEEWKK